MTDDQIDDVEAVLQSHRNLCRVVRHPTSDPMFAQVRAGLRRAVEDCREWAMIAEAEYKDDPTEVNLVEWRNAYRLFDKVHGALHPNLPSKEVIPEPSGGAS